MLVGSGALLAAAGGLWLADHHQAAAAFAVLNILNSGLMLPVMAIAVVALGGFRGLEGEAPTLERDHTLQPA
jgi:hypothetical protein